MNKKIDYFPEWNYFLKKTDCRYKWLHNDYMLVINMYYKVKDSEPKYEAIYERRKKAFKEASLWNKKRKYNEAQDALKNLRRTRKKLIGFMNQIRYLLERKESIERGYTDGKSIHWNR